MNSSTDTPLGFRTRRDVLAGAARRRDSGTWVVCDPLALEHFELTPEQWFIAQQLIGPTSLAEIVRAYDAEFPPARTNATHIWQLVGELHRQGIVVATGRDQAAALGTRRDERERSQWRWGWMQLLALRLPGVHPQRGVDVLYAVARPLLGRFGLALAAMLMVLAVGLVVTRFDDFASRLPTLAALWSPGFVLATIAAICVVKGLHELGHAVVARHYGVDVSEMGVLLLCGMPTLYCDVSDAWRLPRRRERVAITAAGIGVELVLASLACLVWWIAQPGVLQTVALCVMTFATVGTLLINANPLLRYDGYYLLSDLTGTSNLWQRSRDGLRQWTTGWLWHHPPHEPRPPREPGWLAVYGASSQIYIWLLLATIGLFAWRMAAPRDLDILALGVVGLLIAATVAPPLRRAVHVARNPMARRRFRWVHATLALLIAGGVATAIMSWPITYRVTCPVRTDYQASRHVVATLPGQLVWIVESGSAVDRGEPVALLENSDIERELLTAQAEVELAALEERQLVQLRPHDPQAADELPTARARLSAARQRAAALEAESNRLIVVAPEAGVVLEAEPREKEPEPLTLTTWSGTPLDLENRGAWIESGSVLCNVAPSREVRLWLGVSERDVARVVAGQDVRIQLNAVPGRVVTGRVESVAALGQSSGTQQQQWQTGLLDSISDRIRYQALVTLDSPLVDVPAGSGGNAKIEVGRTTIGGSLLHWLRGIVAVD